MVVFPPCTIELSEYKEELETRLDLLFCALTVCGRNGARAGLVWKANLSSALPFGLVELDDFSRVSEAVPSREWCAGIHS